MKLFSFLLVLLTLISCGCDTRYTADFKYRGVIESNEPEQPTANTTWSWEQSEVSLPTKVAEDSTILAATGDLGIISIKVSREEYEEIARAGGNFMVSLVIKYDFGSSKYFAGMYLGNRTIFEKKVSELEYARYKEAIKKYSWKATHDELKTAADSSN